MNHDICTQNHAQRHAEELHCIRKTIGQSKWISYVLRLPMSTRNCCKYPNTLSTLPCDIMMLCLRYLSPAFWLWLFNYFWLFVVARLSHRHPHYSRHGHLPDTPQLNGENICSNLIQMYTIRADTRLRSIQGSATTILFCFTVIINSTWQFAKLH